MTENQSQKHGEISWTTKKHCSPPSVSWMVKNTKKWRVQFSSLVSNLILCSGRYFGFIFFWKNTKNKFTPSLSLQKTSKCVITCKMKNTQFCSFPKSGLKFRVHNNFYHLFFPIFFSPKIWRRKFCLKTHFLQQFGFNSAETGDSEWQFQDMAKCRNMAKLFETSFQCWFAFFLSNFD